MKITDKIPLLKIRFKRTENRILKSQGKRMCVVYSESDKGFKKADEWVEDMETADIESFESFYEKTKDDKEDNLIYCLVKI